jgi:hypothetical protein
MSNKFSAMAINQCHEYNNTAVKEAGGAIGLMTNPVALRHWMVAGPDIARMVSEFEALEARNQSRDLCHHEQHPGVQAAFQNLCLKRWETLSGEE